MFVEKDPLSKKWNMKIRNFILTENGIQNLGLNHLANHFIDPNILGILSNYWNVYAKFQYHLCDGHNAQLKLGIHMWFYSSTGNTKSKISLHCWRMRRGYMCIHFMIAPRRLLNRTGNVMFTWKNYNIFLQFQFWFAYGEIFSFNWWNPNTLETVTKCVSQKTARYLV